MKMILILSSLIASLLTLSASPIPEFPHLSTRGSAQKGIAPDTATVTFTVMDFQEKSEDTVNNVRSYFESTKEEEIQLALFKEACEKAKKKASMLAQASRVTIDRIYAISPNGEDYYSSRSSRNHFGMLPMSAGGGDEDSLPPLFVPAKIYIDTSVSILFRLTDDK